jgi:hypothetical protein
VKLVLLDESPDVTENKAFLVAEFHNRVTFAV